MSQSLKQSVLYVDSTGGLTAARLLQLLQCRTQKEDEQVSAGLEGYLDGYLGLSLPGKGGKYLELCAL